MRAAILLSTALAALAQDPIEVKSVSPPGAGSEELKVEWKAPFLPDGATLSVQIRRLEERYRGGALVPEETPVASGQGYSKGGAFSWRGPGVGPGSFRAAIAISADLQTARALDALKECKVALPQKWTSAFDAWGDDLADRLGPALQQIDQLAAKADAIVQRCAQFAVHRDTWRANVKAVEADVRALIDEIGNSDALKILTASGRRLSSAVTLLLAISRCIRFERDGKFRGFINFEDPANPIVKFEDEDFSWESHRKAFGTTKEAAGREVALWALKDIRRTSGRPSAALQAVLKAHASHAGLAPYAEKLLQGNPPKDLEGTIRKPPK